MIQYKFPLGQNVHDSDDILAMITQLLTEKFTMGERCFEFEKAFAANVGAKYAVMVNSGSSANLLTISALTNYKYNSKLSIGDEVLIPAVIWSTSLFPIIQHKLIPIFVDTDATTLNIDLDDLERKITPKTKALMLVHVLGNCCDMERLMEIVRKHNLILIEDTCESLGSSFSNKYLGTFGAIGTYSFYYSHHITTIEGGMVVTDDEEIFEQILCQRAHGWTRSLKNKSSIHAQNPTIDERFCFYNIGYNVRPTELAGAMGLSQLTKLETKNNNRKINYYKIKEKIEKDPRGTFLRFPEKCDSTDAIWFGVVLFLNKSSTDLNTPTRKEYCNYLESKGVETRPIISGNFIRQPVVKDLYPELDPLAFPGAEIIHHNSLFIGLPCSLMSDKTIDELVEILLSYDGTKV